VAENAGGVHCLKYGLTTHNIQAIEILTIDGEHLRIGGPALDAPGYDLLALMTGSEGLLGVITEVTVKLLPRPDIAQVVMAAFDSVDAAGAGVTAVIASGIIPAGLELLDKPAIDAVEKFIHTGYPKDAAAILLCELDGTQADVTAQVERVNRVFMQAGAIDLQVSHDEEERMRFWAGRKAAFPAMGRLSPDYYCMDGTIPRKHLAQVLNRIGLLSEEYGLPICNVFHAGDGNLHPLILYDANKPGELERTEELGGKILEICVEVGGTITGEHGVGVEKINQMCVQFNAAELQQFHAIKSAFDADNLLNPGKAIPTLHRCAEFGAMHVHHGELPHPELERF
jgi:glycolate oxidase